MATAWAVAMATVNQADECPDVQMTIRREKQKGCCTPCINQVKLSKKLYTNNHLSILRNAELF